MRSTFAPFTFRNYRLYFSGQLCSLIGTWMQQAATAWLVLTISHSGTVLGLVIAAQLLPVLLLSSYGGILADRLNKRKMLIITQAGMGLVSLTLGILVVADAAEIWMITLLAALFGIINAIANPVRQAFVPELVPREFLRRAISLNSMLMSSSRAIGPMIAAVFIATVGIEYCYFADFGTYVFIVVAALMMRTSQLNTTEPAEPAKGQIREGLRYAISVQNIKVPLLMMVLIGTLAYEFQVVLPLLAKLTFHGDANTFGLFTAAQGVGAVAGGLWVARRGHTGVKAVTFGAAMFGLAMSLVAMAPTEPLAVCALFLAGAASVQFLSVGASTIQLTADPKYRGRVMALWTMAFIGSTPIGGPIIGFVSQNATPRLGIALGAAACFAAALIGHFNQQRSAVDRQTVAS